MGANIHYWAFGIPTFKALMEKNENAVKEEAARKMERENRRISDHRIQGN